MKGPSTALQILTAAEDGPLTVPEIVEMCKSSDSHVRTILAGLVKMGELTRTMELHGTRQRWAVYRKPDARDGKPPIWARSVWDYGARP